jgi:hypothetical protein
MHIFLIYNTVGKECPSTTVGQGTQSLGEKSNPWSAFKRVSTTNTTSATVGKKSRKETSDPYICLKCGAELARGGREYYKKRHWEQAHKDEQEGQYVTMIVRKDHEKAKNFLRQMKENKKPRVTSQNEKTKEKDHLPQNTARKDDKIDESTGSKSSPASEESDASKTVKLYDVRGNSTQRSLGSYFKVEEKPEPSVLEKIQSDVNQILVTLGSLKLVERGTHHESTADVNCDVTTLKAAGNLMEVKHPDIHVDTLVDGCKVTCVSCKNYMLSQSARKV